MKKISCSFPGIVFLTLSAVMALPVIFLVMMSFSGNWQWPFILPRSMSFRAWKYVMGTSSGTWTSILTSLKIALGTSLINILLAIPAGNALGRYNFPLKRTIEIFIMLPILVPPVVILMGMHRTFMYLGLTESITGVIIAHILPTLPFMIRALQISFSILGYKWEEQAMLLGASPYLRFRCIVFPFILPGIVAGTALTVLISMSQYVITLLIGEGQVITLTMHMFPYLQGGDQATGSAYAVLFAIVALFLLFLMDVFLNRLYKEKRM